ncbi:methyltransferase domain-containing protein [Winogradskyella sp. 3972H.M.0a.05]|uniref:class I SAM-dependent methyltransferase n=1 Tax=Winogradskyella sp. 3972H.M.0a.05 TaxID=2950277 RepID=UPI003397B6ED
MTHKETIDNSLHCRVCNNSEGNTRNIIAKEMMYGKRETFEYFQCSNCKCLQIVEFPNNIGDYYPNDYYSFSKYDGKIFRSLKGNLALKRYKYTALRQNGLQKLFLSLFGTKGYDIFSGLNINTESKILDVGCGNGEHFLYPLAMSGFKNILGCDPYLAEDIQYDNGLEIKAADVFSMEGKWDFITYHHAFEHLSDPKENLEKIYDLLTEDGVCILRIPTVSSYAWEHYRELWVQLDAPRHFFLHSKESIDILAGQTNLELFKVDYDSTYFQFAGSELYKQDISLSERSKPEVKKLWKSLKRQYTSKAKALNKEGRGDQAIFYLRKKS